MTFEIPSFKLVRPVLKQFSVLFIGVSAFLLSSSLQAGTNIPSQAWSRDINAGGYLDGAPVGGFGAGTYTWNFAGDFYLSRLNIATAPTTWTNNNPYTVDGNCHFYMYQKPSGGAAVTYLLNASTLGTGQATYYSLYPKAWVDYHGTDFPCKARVTQFTPMIPGDDTRSSFPEGIYEWDISNPTCTATDVAIMLTWDNGFGGSTASVTTSGNNTGLVLTRTSGSATSKSQGEFTLAAQSSSGVSVTYESAASVATLQTAFNSAGLLANSTGSNTIGGIAFKVTLSPGQSVKIPIVLAWDIPLAQPGTGAQWYREYTRTYGKTGLNSGAIAFDGLNNYSTWESSIDSWQQGVLTGPYPDWFKQMLFNELYYYVIGGTLWEAGQYGSTSYDAGPDMFGSLESYIYAFYGTSDVRFYGSWALAENWPAIDKQEVEQFCDSVTLTGAQPMPRPAAIGTCAHDFGSLNDVFTHWNDYTYRDSTTWKDLNSKLVLMVYRDWELTGKSDTTFLNYCWPAVQVAMAKVHSECVSGGVTYNLPISSGIDQTYDNLGLTGETAYCGSLFLAACEAAQAIATQEGNAALANTYNSWLTLGQGDFEINLWNATGNYYNIDTGSGAGGVTGVARIMSDQLCGEWYAKACGLPDIVPTAHAVSAWSAVYNNNFSKFDTGTHGVVNVMTSAGNIDTSTNQSDEAWVGTTWGVVAGMVQEGMFNQGVSIGDSLYNSIWNSASMMWFRTPEAWMTGLTSIRAPYYMRANCIWSVKNAYGVNSPCGGSICTPIPTFTPSRTATLNCPSTPTFTQTPTNTQPGTPTSTPTASRTSTATLTATSSATSSPSPTRTNTPSLTPTSSATNSVTSTKTNSATLTVTSTATASTTATHTASPTLTATPSASATPTASFTPSRTSTFSPTNSFTATWSSTPTSTPSSSPTATPSRTPTASATNSPTSTATPSRTHTPTFTPTNTRTVTPTNTATSTITYTPTLTPTGTMPPTNTPTLTPTDSKTPTPTLTPTSTPTSTATSTTTSSATSTTTQTATNSSTITPTSSPTQTATRTATPTITSTPTDTNVITPTFTGTPTHTSTATPTNTAAATSTSTATATFTSTSTATQTSTPTLTPTHTPSMTPTASMTATGTPTQTPSFTPTSTETDSATSTRTATPTSSPTPTMTVGSTLTPTGVPTTSTITVEPPYPNPSTGSPVVVVVTSPGQASAQWNVFTTAFRKVANGSLAFNGNGFLQWDLKDKNGVEVSSGLYYFRVQIQAGNQTVRRIFKVLVLR